MLVSSIIQVLLLIQLMQQIKNIKLHDSIKWINASFAQQFGAVDRITELDGCDRV